MAASAAAMAAALPKSKTSAAMGKKHIYYPITQSFHNQVLATFPKYRLRFSQIFNGHLTLSACFSTLSAARAHEALVMSKLKADTLCYL